MAIFHQSSDGQRYGQIFKYTIARRHKYTKTIPS